MKLVNAGLVFLLVALIAGCATDRKSEPSSAIRKTSFAGEVIEKLQRADNEYEAAGAAGDGVAMTRAALARLDAPGRLAPWRVEVGLFNRTRIMLFRARIIAGDDEEAQAAIRKLIKEADLGPDAEIAAAGNMADPDTHIFDGQIANMAGSLFGEQFRTYALEAGGEKTLNLQVTASRGAIVYVEAPQQSGIVLTIRMSGENKTGEVDKTVICRDPNLHEALANSHGILICRWRPKYDGVVKIILENPGLIEESILMITNQ